MERERIQKRGRGKVKKKREVHKLAKLPRFQYTVNLFLSTRRISKFPIIDSRAKWIGAELRHCTISWKLKVGRGTSPIICSLVPCPQIMKSAAWPVISISDEFGWGFWHTGVAVHWDLSKLQGEAVIVSNPLRLPSSLGGCRYKVAESKLGVISHATWVPSVSRSRKIMKNLMLVMGTQPVIG